MHTRHMTMANTNRPIGACFSVFDVRLGEALPCGIREGDAEAENGFLQRGDAAPGLGISVTDTHIHNVEIIE